MDEEKRSKLLTKAKTLRYDMIFYVICMLLLQVLSYLRVNMFWPVLVALATSIPCWMLYVKYGLLGILTAMFSLNNYDVYVNGVKSESKKEEMQNSNDLIQLVIMLAISVAGVVTTGVLVLGLSITLLIQSLFALRKDKAFGKSLLRSIGITWLIAVVAYVGLTIFINII